MNYPSLRYQKIQSVVVLAIMNDRRVENSSDMLFFPLLRQTAMLGSVLPLGS